MIETQEINTSEALHALRPEWNTLWSQATEATPFQSPDWLISWWTHLGSGRLSALALRQNKRLVGLIPWSAREDRSVMQRKIVFLGQGVSDYLDGLFERGFEQAGAEESLKSLQKTGRDACELSELAPYSPFLSVCPPTGWHADTLRQNVCPVLRLPSQPADLTRFVPARQLEKLRYYRERARRLCGMQVECATEPTFPEFFSAFLRLHRARWAERGQRGVLADPALEKFHFEVAGAFLRQKMLRLYILRLETKIAAALYLFTHRRRAYYYLGGFDPEFKNFSPGMLLIGEAIERAVLENAEEFDFLRGCESYKYGWGAVDRATFRRTFSRPETCNEEATEQCHLSMTLS
jgi:CelD/BcsL family acetyltransferase involved in cellulose biosynthesis